jgi:hypothetical protein
MKKLLTLIFLSGLCLDSFCQHADSIRVSFRNCVVNSLQLEHLDNMNIEFVVTKTLRPDTLRFELVHHRGEVPFFRTVYRLACEQIESYHTLKIMGVKPGDQLSFLYKYDGAPAKRTYVIGSTMSSLTKPYYLDLYFLYNKDTLTTDQFSFQSKLQLNRNEKFIRLYYNDPKELPKSPRVDHRKEALVYPLDSRAVAQLFHGRVILHYADTKKLKKLDPFNKKIDLWDWDAHTGLGHGTIK